MDLAREVQILLEDDEVRVIGIFGMGGVGKTTLLEKIQEFLSRSYNFDVVIWIVASKEINVVNIQKSIGKKLGLSLSNDQDQRAQEILNSLSRKKFVVLLDDVWEKLDLEKVGIPKCKLVFTTQSEAVCKEMEADKKIKVEILGRKEAWALFRSKVGEKAMGSHPKIPELAETVAKQCDGLPHALVTIGRSMACMRTPEEWKHLITRLHKSPSLLHGMGIQLLSYLKRSYNNLVDDTTRKCFLYCSLFPKGFGIEKGKLIDYWVGEGFLDNDGAREEGHDLIVRLKDACLLEDGDGKETEVKMHNVMRNLALWIASEYGNKKDKFLAQGGFELREVQGVESWEETERISLMGNKLEALMEIPKCPSLLTLMLQENRQLSNISKSFFKYMPRLRVLDLSFTNLKEFPTGIGELFELQYLDLSHTQIERLPRELTNLTKLKHLNLNCTISLETIPREVIACLLSLRALNLDHSGYEACGLDLADLKSLKKLSDLGIIGIRFVPALQQPLWSEIATKYTRDVGNIDCDNFTCFQLLSIFGNMKSLEGLGISNCEELEELVIGTEVEKESQLLSSLGSLSLQYLFKLKTLLVSHRSFQNLRFVNIVGCSKLRNVTWILHLQCLERITLHHCYEMEEVIGGVDGADEELRTLPNLKVIYIKSLPVLKSICRQTLVFPALNYLVVSYCRQLKKLPLGLHNVNTLQEIRGKGKWWDGLEWKDDIIKSAFHACFVEYEEEF